MSSKKLFGALLLTAAIILLDRLPSAAENAPGAATFVLPGKVFDLSATILPLAQGAKIEHKIVAAWAGKNGNTAVSIPIEDKDETPPRLVAFSGVNSDGEKYISEMRRLTGIDESVPGKYSCQKSERQLADEKLNILKDSSLQELVDIREKKRALLLERVRSQLTPGVIKSLRKLESQYGLTSTPELSVELPTEQLLWRLLLLQTSAQNQISNKTIY